MNFKNFKVLVHKSLFFFSCSMPTIHVLLLLKLFNSSWVFWVFLKIILGKFFYSTLVSLYQFFLKLIHSSFDSVQCIDELIGAEKIVILKYNGTLKPTWKHGIKLNLFGIKSLSIIHIFHEILTGCICMGLKFLHPKKLVL